MPGLSNPAFNDNAVPYGSRTEVLKRNQLSPATLGTYVCESISISRPAKEIERPDQVGGPNGFVLVNAQEDGSCVIQWGNSGTPAPQNGDWFVDTFDSNIGVEKYVLLNIGLPFEINGYYKANAKLKRAYYS